MKVKTVLMACAAMLMLSAGGAQAQFSRPNESAVPTKTTFIRLGNGANAILVEPVTPDPVRGHMAIVVSHPEHVNNFNYFIARTLPTYGYPVLAINDYGPETTFYELLGPISSGIKALKERGFDKIVLAGHSSGGAEMAFYQDVAENGPASCQQPERIYKCTTKEATGLPKADAIMLLDPNSGAPERTYNYNPAAAPHDPRKIDQSLNMFSPANGYDPVTGTAKYSPEFLKKFFAAQVGLVNGLIDEASGRLDKINKGEGQYANDEPFVRQNRSVFVSEGRPEIAYIGLLSKSHAPHLLLKGDGTRTVQILNTVRVPEKDMRPVNAPLLYPDPDMETVRQFLSSFITRLKPDYHWTEDHIYGIDWHSSPSSLPGSVSGIHSPTLIMSGTCAAHIVFHETAFDMSPAADKDYVGLEGANHGLQPCRPEYGDTYKRAFDYVDAWLLKPGRLR